MKVAVQLLFLTLCTQHTKIVSFVLAPQKYTQPTITRRNPHCWPIFLQKNKRIICNDYLPIAANEGIRKSLSDFVRKSVTMFILCPLLFGGTLRAHGDDELARYAAEGNKVGVDTQCFFRKCALETATCANDPNCLKGLACLAR